MNFAREKYDERAMQSLMRNNVFSLHLGKECCCCVADWGWHFETRMSSTVEPVSILTRLGSDASSALF
jgi:hypothetical protein